MTILTVEMSSEKQLRELESSTKALCIHLGSLSLIRSLSLPSHYFHPHLSLHISYPNYWLADTVFQLVAQGELRLPSSLPRLCVP